MALIPRYTKPRGSTLYHNAGKRIKGCLGLVKYVSNQGSAPISITYKLDNKMPMEIFKASNQVVKIVSKDRIDLGRGLIRLFS